MTTVNGGTGVEVLLVEDNEDEARLIERVVSEYQTPEFDRQNRDEAADQYPVSLEIGRIHHVGRLEDALETIRTGSIESDTERDDVTIDVDVVLLDLMLPDSRGVDTVSRFVARSPAVPVVVLTGHDQHAVGVEVIRRGAQDYLTKGCLDGELIVRSIRYAIERKRHQRVLEETNQKLALLNRIIRTDIRTETSVVLGWADVLEDRLDPAGREAFDSMLAATRNVVEFADMAADLSMALESDADISLSVEPRSLEAILESEAAAFREAYPTVALAIDVDDSSMTVLATPMLGAAFGHLLSNLGRHGVAERISVTVDVADGHVTVHVMGRGATLSAEQRRFLTGTDRWSAVDGGLNTELYLAKTLFEQCGGMIDIGDSRDGTTVSITLERALESSA
ncbi:ATP-binding response regulator [Natronosalvus rutilus]|uniref:Response regulator n=1 Tax=Natronosalvus rutilus TaxID=2953753 RepID=A0A9E7NEN8_9EURY|nr:response regulator [Natronosalvus rutilus]UTF55609.1 response regulator [Natronosalvus rutilus]